MNGTDVKALLPFPAGKITDQVVLPALRMACWEGWPFIRQTNYVSGGAFVSGATSYTLTPAATAPISNEGIARVYAAVAGQPHVLLSGVREHENAGVWSLEFESSIALKYAGQTFYIEYQSRITPPTTMETTLNASIPENYWVRFVSLYLIENGINVPLTGQREYQVMLGNYTQVLEKIKAENAVRPMTKIGIELFAVGRP